MGNTGSTATNNSTVNLSQTNKVVSNYLSSISQTASADAVNINDMELVVGHVGDGCDINASQNINSSVKAMGQLTSTMTQEIQNRIKADLANQVQQAATAQTGAFATGSSSTNNVSNYTSAVNNIVESNLTDQKQQQIYAKVFNSNRNKITIGDCSSKGFTQAKVNASQNIVSDLVASAMMDSISKQLNQYDAQVSQSNTTNQTGSATTTGPIQDLFKGLNDMLSTIFGAAIAAYLGPFLIVCCVCLCLCCCAYIGYKASQKSGNGSGSG